MKMQAQEWSSAIFCPPTTSKLLYRRLQMFLSDKLFKTYTLLRIILKTMLRTTVWLPLDDRLPCGWMMACKNPWELKAGIFTI